jgi:hypothetical protein
VQVGDHADILTVVQKAATAALACTASCLWRVTHKINSARPLEINLPSCALWNSTPAVQY